MCILQRPSGGFNGDFKPLRDEHEACRETLPQKKQDYISCHKIRESLVTQDVSAIYHLNICLYMCMCIYVYIHIIYIYVYV